jgi:DNA modification methylase
MSLGERLALRGGMEITRRSVKDLLPYARNARTHSDMQVNQIAASMREWGWTNPVLIDEANMIIAGHGRVLAANKLGLHDDIPCIVLTELTDVQKQALIIADNKLAMNAGWNDEMLLMELGEIHDAGFNLDTVGFSDAEMAALLAGVKLGEGNTDPDDVPTPPMDPVSVLGDSWILGAHRLQNGDCTDPDAVEKALNGVKPHLMVTDPPYGVKYNPSWRSGLDKIERATGKVSNDDQADWKEAYALFPGDVAYVWHAPQFAATVQTGLEECGFKLRTQIIWVKPHFVLSRGDYHSQHEPCLYMVKKSATGHWAGDRKQTTVWQINNGTFQGGKAKPEDEKTGHGTQKPVECMRRPIENNSSPGQAVYEPFSGSGTTIIACEMTGRSCHSVELDPKYVDCAIIRWQNFTGKEAVLASTGKTYAEMSAERSART